MSRTLYNRMQLAEARGEIPENSAGRLTSATIGEAAMLAFAKGYYGEKAVADALANTRRERLGASTTTTADLEEQTMHIADTYIAEARGIVRTLVDTHTTSDFPLAFAALRQRTVRESDSPDVQSGWRTWGGVRERTTPDFRISKGIKLDVPGDLLLRPEATDVKYTTFGETEDGYSAANYERAWKYTWEMHLADDIGLLAGLTNEMGKSARRTEVRVVFEAILAGLTRKNDAGFAGAVTLARLKALRASFGGQTIQNADKKTIDLGLDMTDIVYGLDQRDAIFEALNQLTLDGSANGAPNVMRGALNMHFERLWRRVFGADYLVFDATTNWLEVMFLEGFQNGAKFYAKMPDVDTFTDEGSFADHSLHGKVGHALGAKIVSTTGAQLIKGS